MSIVFRFFSSAIDLHPFLPRSKSRKDAHVALRHPVMQSEKFDQRLVRLAVDRARGEAHLDAFAVAAGKFRARSAWLNVQLQDHRDATRYKEATAGRMCQSTISTTWIRTTSTSGVRSNWPTGGM